MPISNYGLELAGFSKLSDNECVSGRFHALHIYEVVGAILDVSALAPVSASIDDIHYQVSIGSDINEISRNLAGYDLVENQNAWQREHNCAPPYLIVHLGATKVHNAFGCYVKEQGKEIITQNRFAAAKEELKEQGKTVLPRLLSAFSAIFSTAKCPISFKHVDHEVFGKTDDGKCIYDLRFLFSGAATISSSIKAEDLQSRISQSIDLIGKMNMKSARFYHLGLGEDDSLKKFLFFFLAIEIQTHSVFKNIAHEDGLSALLTPPKRAINSTKALFKVRNDYMKSLHDRFVWCVLCVWKDLTDLDVETFTELRRVRDDIAHGSISIPPKGAVANVQDLATKLQLSYV